MISKFPILGALLVVAAACVQSPTLWAEESCNTCRGRGHDQCCGTCDKVCTPVQRIKAVPCIVWEVVCKDICLRGKSCGCQGTCGKVRTVKRLIRRTIIKQVPVTECVVGPGCSCGGAGHDEGEWELPTPPASVRQPKLHDHYIRSGQPRQKPNGPGPMVTTASHLSVEPELPSGRTSAWSLFAK